MFEPKVKNRQTDMLMNAVIQLHDVEDAYRFFEDLCTIPEIRCISQRLEVADLLRKKETYQRIVEETGASSATISRVNRALNYGPTDITVFSMRWRKASNGYLCT